MRNENQRGGGLSRTTGQPRKDGTWLGTLRTQLDYRTHTRTGTGRVGYAPGEKFRVI